MESGAQSIAPLGPTGSTWQAPYDAIVKAANCSAPLSDSTGSAAANQSTFECLKALPAEQLLNASLSVKDELQYSGS